MLQHEQLTTLIKIVYGTQRNAAVEMGINEQTLSNWCTGKTKPKRFVIDSLQAKAREKISTL